MDEQMNTMPQATDAPLSPAQTEVTAPPQQPLQTPAGAPGDQNYATFLERFLAVLIDAVLLMIVGMVLGLIFGSESSITQLLNTLLGIVYYVYMVGTYGATFGKKAMNIRIVKDETGAQLNYVDAFLREVVGKFISFLPVLVGFFWMLWDPKKQTWHDKIVKTVVIKTK